MDANIGSGGPFEDMYGYSRVVRRGNQVWVAGTCARDEAIEGDAYAQASDILHLIENWLGQVGASLTDVVRTVTYVTDIRDIEKVAAAHSRAFGEVRPAATLVEVSALADPRYLVEIQADAVVTEG